MQFTQLPKFKVIGAQQVAHWLETNPQKTFDLVRDAYLLHAQGKAVNPDSYFLRFPDSDRNRIIALPASIESDTPVTGIKWISSFPANVEKGLDRASAALLINDRHTGYPLACIEGSLISLARTAASAAIGAHYLHPVPGHIASLGVVGAGPIAFRSVQLLVKMGWKIDELCITDLSEARAVLFRERCARFIGKVRTAQLQTTITESAMILFATSAAVPFVTELAWFKHNPTVLHMSLRDLAPEIILASQNVADDVDHCLKAQTSPHLASLQSGNREFMAGGAAAAILGDITPDASRPRIFSPFGMGILDLAVAQEILRDTPDEQVVAVPDFFPVPYVL